MQPNHRAAVRPVISPDVSSDDEYGYDSDSFKPLPMHRDPEPPAFLKEYMQKQAAAAKSAAAAGAVKASAPPPPVVSALGLAVKKRPKPEEPPAAPLVSKLAKKPAVGTPKVKRTILDDDNNDTDSEDDAPLTSRVAAPTEASEAALKAKILKLEQLRRQFEKLSTEIEKEHPGSKPPMLTLSSKAVGKQVARSAAAAATGAPLPSSVLTRLAPMVEYLRSKMDDMRADLYAREREDIEAYSKGVVPSWRDAQGRESTYKLVNLEHLLNTDREFISYETFCDITHHESLLSVLGGSGPGHRAFLRSSNKETRTFEYIYKNLEHLLAPLATETSLFKARPEQLLAVAEKLCKYDVDLSCSVRQLNEGIEDAVEYMRTANCMPAIDLINYATGNGKTWATILSAMTEVGHPQLWSRFLESWRDIVKTNTVQAYLGLCRCENLDGQQLTRVVVALIPEQLLGQWESTANAVSAAMQQQHGIGFLIWRGLTKLQRATKNDPLGKERTLKEAHEACTAANKAMLWLVPAKTESAKKTVRAAPNLHIPIRIYDEMSTRTEPKSKQPESRVMKNVIVQATVERLQRATRAQTEHPLRKALAGIDFDASCTHHAAAFHLLTAPDWLRLMVSKGMASTMPSGIRKVSLKARLQSLAARVNSSDMNITSLDELLEAMMKNAGANYTAMTNAQRKDFLQRCRGILGAAAPAENDAGNTIHERLTKALEEVKALVAAMPEPIQPAAPDQPILQAAIDANADIEREKRIMNVMIRMLTNLAEAVCVDPPPECPITMEDIPPEHVGIFPCCTNLFDARYKDQLNGKCPMCRAPINGVIVASQAVGALVDQPKPKPAPAAANGAGPSGGASPPGSPGDVAFVGDEVAMLARFDAMASKVKFTMASKAVAKTVREYLRFKPRGARILLAFACYGFEDEQEGTQKTRDLLMADVPELTSVSAVHKKRPQNVEDFVRADDSNRVLVINTNDRSSSLEGLDLWNTGMVIIDRLKSGHMSAAKIVQTIGRAMRPQEKNKSKAPVLGRPRFDAASAFPAKLIVLLEQTREAPPADADGEAMDEDH